MGDPSHVPFVLLDPVCNGSPSAVLREEAEVFRGKRPGLRLPPLPETSLAPASPLSTRQAPRLQVPARPPKGSTDSSNQGSPASGFSSTSLSSRREEPKKDYREVRPQEGGRPERPQPDGPSLGQPLCCGQGHCSQ